MFVVVMFEPALECEELTISEQLNEIFGPFDTDLEAEQWTIKAEKLIRNRQWLITPLNNKNALNAIDPERN
jgi:hypothetical protein